jgi:hypothetical protein
MVFNLLEFNKKLLVAPESKAWLLGKLRGTTRADSNVDVAKDQFFHTCG